MTQIKAITANKVEELLSSDEEDTSASASSGHKLGQLVGDWFQDDFVSPILSDVAKALDLYLDHRKNNRTVRGEKIIWKDEDGNGVDYDFVLELGGSDTNLGIPVAFFECFWRRGSRHSKDKARDDSGKLMPMRNAYPTARFLGIVGSGDFTNPARELIQSRGIDLFYIPKHKIIESFASLNMVMDYADKADEKIKGKLATTFAASLDGSAKTDAAKKLRDLMTNAVISGYIDRVKSTLSALPQEIRIIRQLKSKAVVFDTVDDAYTFLSSNDVPEFDFSDPETAYTYEVTYSDGREFSRDVESLDQLRDLNSSIKHLSDHMQTLAMRS